MPDPAAPAKSAAGIVRTPGIDDVIEGVEEAADFAAYRKKFFEGEELSPQEVERKKQLLRRIVDQVNVNLAGRVRIVSGWPELNGFGAKLNGVDSDGRVYSIEYHADDEMRMANERDDTEPLVREIIDNITTEVLRQRAIYMHRMTGETVGTA